MAAAVAEQVEVGLRSRGLLLRIALTDAAASADGGGPGGAGVVGDADGDAADEGSASAGEDGEAATSSTGLARLASDVFYGRPILRVPAIGGVISADSSLPEEAADLLDDVQQRLAGAPAEHEELAALALALLAEHRRPPGEGSPFRRWIDMVLSEPLPPALNLTERQLGALRGTTVEALVGEMAKVSRVVAELAPRLGARDAGAASPEAEASSALGAVLRHAVPVEPPPDLGGLGGGAEPGLVLLPFLELLHVQRSPDIAVGAPLKEALLASRAAPGGGRRWRDDDEEDRAGEVLVLSARRDHQAGEDAPPLWLGRLSNSELALRRGGSGRTRRNPTGIGGGGSPPENWSPNRKTPNFKEYAKFNCTSRKAFEMRFSSNGWPNRIFVRCSRIAYHLSQGTYGPSFAERMELLDKWPPPKKYGIDDWLTWTQADQVIARSIQTYCSDMKRQLKETINAATAEDFRRSTDPTDVLLWRLRSEEARTFRECVALARSA